MWQLRGSLSRILDKYLPAQSLKKRLAIGMSWVTAGSLFRQISNFLAVIIVARVIGMSDFGKLAVIQSTVLMISSFGQAGIGLSTAKYIASNRVSDPQRTGRIIGFTLAFVGGVSLAIGLLVVSCSHLLADKLLPGRDIAGDLSLSSVWMMFEIISLIQFRMLAGLESFRSCATITSCQGVLLPIVWVTSHYGGVTGAVLGYSAVSIIGCLVGQVMLQKECQRLGVPITYRKAWGERSILRMSTMVWLSEIAMNATNWAVGILLARRPDGLAEYAIFNAASRYQNVLAFLPTRIFHVSLPVLANLQAEGNRHGFTRALVGLGVISLLVTAAGASLLMLFPDILMSWYGKGFGAGSDVLGVVAVLCVATSVWTVASAGLWAAEQSRQMLGLDLLRGSILVLLCMAGGATTARGLALAHLVSYSAGGILLVWVLYRYLRQPWSADQPAVRADL
ncbi:oligosaccharide flippase family protein [Geomonas anaerohicana]|uniref:Oligosaccharide flippase family protein n=1 Tax=Geomonas anaerohicana TaxID=2798583 RepID=A0ABS0YIA3_9BACT|nr:oligosaccharide flippase family protein [Geomonas anaerohicana]MBJ6751622.1 oligosaccharide flippase family protein [Geomonas anaerohicana]